MKFKILLLLLNSCLSGWVWANIMESPIIFSTFKTHSRIQFRLFENLNPVLKKDSSGFELFFPHFSFNDWGILKTQVQQWKHEFEKSQDLRIKNLQFVELENGLKISGQWTFSELWDPLHQGLYVDAFDYSDLKKNEYTVDFWVRSHRDLHQNSPSIKKSNEVIKKLQKAEGDFLSIENYCSEKISKKNDLFLEFHPVHPRIDFSKWLPLMKPDQDYSYFRPKKKSDDSRYVGLILDLYEQHRPALALRMLEVFKNKFPYSDFKLEMQLIEASLLGQLGLQVKSQKILENLINEAGESQVGRLVARFLAAQFMDNQQYLEAMKKFYWLTEHPSDFDDNLQDVFHLGLAECFYAMHQFESAAKEYEWIVEHVESRSWIRGEAAVRQGDVYLEHLQYEQALGVYSQALQGQQNDFKRFPAFALNWGETLYHLRQYERSKVVFENFLNHSGAYPEGWRATFRLGEIAALQSAVGIRDPVAKKWFYETMNRFPTSIGAVLSRLRLLPCSDHVGLDLLHQEKFYRQAHAKVFNDESNSKKIWLKHYDDFIVLTQLRTLFSMGLFEKVTLLSLNSMYAIKNPIFKKTIFHSMHSFFKKTITSFLNANQSFKALNFYALQRKNLNSKFFKFNENFEFKYFLELSRLALKYEMLNLSKLIEKDYENFIDKKNKLFFKDSKSLANRDTGMFYDLVRDSEKSFLNASILWKELAISEENNVDKIKKTKDFLNRVHDESSFAFEKNLMLASLSQKENFFEKSIFYIKKAQLLLKNPSEDLNLRLLAWIAFLEFKLKHNDLALNLYNELESKIKANHFDSEYFDFIPQLPTLDQIQNMKAQIYESKSKWSFAKNVYLKMIKNGNRSDQVLYHYAIALVRMGNQNQKIEAQKIFTEIINNHTEKNKNDIFWNNVASIELDHLNLNK